MKAQIKSFKIRPDLIEPLKERAEKEERSQSQIINRAIKYYLNNQKP